MADPLLIRCATHGPYLVEGPLRIQDPTGAIVTLEVGQKAALCRCGHSGNKPFCDGEHRKAGFVAAEPAKQP